MTKLWLWLTGKQCVTCKEWRRKDQFPNGMPECIACQIAAVRAEVGPGSHITMCW